MPRGYKNNGEKLIPPSMKGKKRSPQSIEKLRKFLTGRQRPEISGEKNGMWKGGISKDKEYWKKRRINIRENKANRKRPEQCEICGILGKDLKRGLCYDHDHITGKFRGWICMRCNTTLGLVKENTETLMDLIEYIKKNRLNIK